MLKLITSDRYVTVYSPLINWNEVRAVNVMENVGPRVTQSIYMSRLPLFGAGLRSNHLLCYKIKQTTGNFVLLV